MATYYWIGGTGTWDNANTTNWSNTSGGASGFGPPLATDAVIFDANSGSGICTTAATAAAFSINLGGSVELKLGANLSLNNIFTFTSGTFTLQTYALSAKIFSSSNTNTRVLNFDTGVINITDTSATVWTTGNLTGFSYTGTPIINLTYSGAAGTRTITCGTAGGNEARALPFNITAGTDIVTISAGSNIRALNFTGFAGTFSNTAFTLYRNLTFVSGMTVNAGANALTLAGTSGSQQITTAGKTLDFPVTQNGVGGTVQLQDNLTMGSTRTFTLTAGTLDLTGNSGNWTLSTGLFASSNSNTRSIAFGTGNITVTGNNGNSVNIQVANNFTYTGTPIFNATYSGSTGTRAFYFGSTSGATESNAPTINVTAGTDTVATPTIYLKNFDITGFAGTLSNNVRTIYGNFTISTGATLSAGTSTTTFAGTSGTQQITTAGKTFDYPIIFNGIGGTFAFQDALTQGSTRAFTITNGTVQLKNGVTSTVGAFATSGTNQKFLQSTLAGSQATLSQASGTVDASYLTIRDINATGGATWNAYVDNSNIDAGNNDGWDFGISPVIGGAEYTYQLRSFTQPRRF